MKKILFHLSLKQAALISAVLGLAVGILFTMLIADRIISEKENEYSTNLHQLTEENENLQNSLNKKNALENNAELLKQEDGWSLALVNASHPLDSSYKPAEMAEIEPDRSVDARIVEPLEQMLSDGAAAGLKMYVASAYRSYDKQTEVFNATMQEWLGKSYEPLAAYSETKKSVAVPGTSEHSTGLAVDIIATDHEELDEAQGNTPEQQWLMEHCWEYGFILRYPPEKADVTGIIYEPWHYRYVGKEAAEEIMTAGITLEEYLEE